MKGKRRNSYLPQNIIMNRTKILTIGAIALAVLGSATPAMAETGPSTKDVNLKYQVDESYEWSIHPAIDFGKNAGVNTTVSKTGNVVKVTKNVLHEGAKLKIVVKGSGTDGAFSINNGKKEVLNYAINDGANALAVGGEVLVVPAGTNEGNKSLEFKLSTAKRASEIAGAYTGTVTYTASIVG